MTALQLVIDSMTASSVLLLSAFGLYLVFGLYRVVNMAHGEFIVLGGYIAAHLQAAGLSFAFIVIAAGLGVGLFALVLELLMIGRLRQSSSLSPVLATWGIGVVMSQCIRLVFGPAGVAVYDPVTWNPVFFGVAYSGYQLALIGVAACLVFMLWFVLHRLPLGLLVQAQTSNETLAQLHGVNVRLQFTVVFFVGGVLAGMAGALLAPIASISPSSGPAFSISSYMVVIVGGMHHTLGQVLGAVIVGGGRTFISALSTTTLATLGTLLIVALILAVRPKDELVD